MLTMASGTPPKIPRAVKLMETYASGLGAVKLASSVQALRLQVNRRPKRVGEGQFLKNVLPRLAYNNPGIPFHVTYLQQQQQETATEASQQAESSSSGSVEKKPKKEQQGSAVITIEYADIPARQIHLGDKPSSSISRELLDLARFTDEAIYSQSSSKRATSKATSPGAGQRVDAGAVEEILAPEASASNLAGSAEGLADVDGVGAVNSKQ